MRSGNLRADRIMRTFATFALASALVASVGCSAAAWQGIAQGLAATQPGAEPAGLGLAGNGQELLIFGGEGHKTFLGCLTCSKFSADSVMNQYGTYGSKYGAESVLNPYGPHGSKFSTTGACNPYAADPPVIVDRAGNYYGRLSLNRASRTNSSTINAWVEGVCAGR